MVQWSIAACHGLAVSLSFRRVNVLVVDTPEGVRLRFGLAGVGSRTAAGLLDLLFLGLGTSLVAFALLATAAFDPSGVSGFVAAFVLTGLLLGWIGYFAAFQTAWNGETPGKRALGLRVIASDGRPATSVQFLLRSLLWPIDVVIPLPFLSVGSVLVAATARHQRLGDLAARTVVVRVETTEREAEPFPDESYDALEGRTTHFGAAEAARLTTRDVAFLRRLLVREGLEPEQRRRLFVDAAAHYAELLAAGPFEDARLFLREVYLFARQVR